MRVRLKGINRVTVKLADGTRKTYYYAWKGGPRLAGEPGTPEFLASLNEAVKVKPLASAGTLSRLLRQYRESAEFQGLAPRTRKDYDAWLDRIEQRFGTFPLAAAKDRRARGKFLEWRDGLALKSKRQADLGWTVLARVFSWGLGRGHVDANPCKGGGRLYEAGARRDKVWTDDDEAAFLAVARGGIRLAYLLAINTGQRQGDLLRLEWKAYDGHSIRLRQSKTGVRVRIPVTAQLKAALDAERRVSATILTNSDGMPWTEDGFRSSWRKARLKTSVEGLTFHDLRGTAVTRLFIADCTVPEVATITGHSLDEVKSILDANYFSRDYALAESGIAKLETRTEKAKRSPKRDEVSEDANGKDQ